MRFSCRDNDDTKEEKSTLKEKSGNRKGNRFHPYGKEKGSGEKKGQSRNRVFISNIPYDMKWQAIKDLMREKGKLWLQSLMQPYILSVLSLPFPSLSSF